jgi:hypothetical protein
MLTITPPRLALIIIAAREREVEMQASKAGGSAATPARDRLLQRIGRVEPEELAELVALAWIGRGDFDAADLPEALRQARKIMGTRPVDYLAGMPGLADYLERALAALGYAVEEFQILPA